MLLAAYFSTMDDIGVKTWLAHDSLLGWWKTGKVSPSRSLAFRENSLLLTSV